MGVRRAPYVTQQRHVEDLGQVLVAEPEVTAEAESDEAGAQGLLQGLAHAEVGGERERRDQLCQPEAGCRRPHGHQPL